MTAPSRPSQPRSSRTAEPADGGPSLRAVTIVVVAAVAVAATVVGSALWAVVPGVVTPPSGDAATSVGASSDGYRVWERNADGTPVRWDPCTPIVVVLETTGSPAQAADDLEEATRRLRAVTGLDLRAGGTVDERPSADRQPYQPDRYGDRWAPVLVAWARPGERDIPLRDIDRGVGMPVAVGGDGDRTYVTGQVVLNVERDDLRPAFDDRASSWGATLLHELAHVLGLGHVDDPTELMHVHPGSGPVVFGDGDRAGLEAVGTEGGCRLAPDPGPVDVAPPEQ